METEMEMRATRLLTPRLRYIRPSAWGCRMAGEGPGKEGLRAARGRAGERGGGCPSSFLGKIVSHQWSPPRLGEGRWRPGKPSMEAKASGTADPLAETLQCKWAPARAVWYHG